MMVINLKEKAIQLLNMFYDNGYEAYVVGGFVRDLILGRKSFDVDITTNATPKQMQEIFKNVKLPFESYGSVKLTYKKVDFEITTYRMDLEYQDKRKPSKIIYTDKLIVDLRRRDFTMNTLCMDKDGNILDLLDGTTDIKNRSVRVVGEANKRIKEDALRILRAIRFATELDFELDIELQNAIINNRESLTSLSYFRKKQELNRIFSSTNVYKGLKLLKELGLDTYLEISISDDIVRTSDPIGIWAQVLVSDNYPFTNNEKDYLDAILRVLKDKDINDMELYKEGNYVCYIASEILNVDSTNIYDRYDSLPIKKREDINLNGKDIIDILGLKEKSEVKLILSDIEEKIVLGKLSNEKQELSKYIIDTYLNNML